MVSTPARLTVSGLLLAIVVIPVELWVKATDSNGQPVFGSDFELTLLLRSISLASADSLVIPDTLWTYRAEMTDPRMTVTAPDSLLPAGTLLLEAHLDWIGPTGQLEERQLNLSVERPNEELLGLLNEVPNFAEVQYLLAMKAVDAIPLVP